MDIETTETAQTSNGNFVTNNNNNNNNSSANTNNNNNNNNNNNQNNNSVANINHNRTPGCRFRSGQDRDIVRLIGQHLINLGLKQTVDSLLEESGIGRLDHPAATKFKQHILNGEWEKADKMLGELAVFISGDVEANIAEIRLLIAEQNFLEYIEDGLLMKALKCLRNDLAPYIKDSQRLQHLTTLLTCRSTDEVRTKAGWAGKGLKSRQNLMEKFHKYIPPSVMLPPKRLSTLLTQATRLQKDRCLLHNPLTDSEEDYIDLMSDHQCKPNAFPSVTVQELTAHKDEVWYCKFSNNGKKLATCGVTGRIIIWDLDPVKKQLFEKCVLTCPCYAVGCLSWSPDDTLLLACGSEERPECWLWDVQAQEIKSIVEKSEDDSMATCSWHSSGETFAVASIRGNFAIYDKDANRKCSREGVRVKCLSFLNHDPKHILAADALNRIRLYATTDMSLNTSEEDVLEEKHSIMTFCIDKDDKYIAINLIRQGIHLWDYKNKTLLRMLPGVRERSFTIYSSFSPLERKYLASGSEDGKVYIYRPDRDQPVIVLLGHSRCVSCVSWNPKYPDLLASVSDDRTVRLWGPSTSDDNSINTNSR